MTEKEKGIIADVEKFISCFNDPPPATMKTSKTDEWWNKCCDQLIALSQKWNNHPLALKLGEGAFAYIEIKSKVKAGKKVTELYE